MVKKNMLEEPLLKTTEETYGPQWVGQLQYWLAIVFVVGWSFVITCGFIVQFTLHELPCPLCMIQRMFMILAAMGAAYIVHTYETGAIKFKDYMMGWGMTILACMAGGFAAWRQTILHILPGNTGYGTPVMGLHLYVWALILFMLAVVVAAIALATSHYTAGVAHVTKTVLRVGHFALYYLMAIILANMMMVFVLEGFHPVLPDDPTNYRLLNDLGIKH